ncbi:DUF2142 domain-containing protein [Lactovum miscens]|uniref:Putative membrane protein n=1 Tax=Lactovum miscens TaxID=190387 RepID=A0A841C188_9LACT|nr:DUF2142 domain-containing protein [Lactovum miscens]MBB5887676.1 putative membrane protein [Lactovum miscens]
MRDFLQKKLKIEFTKWKLLQILIAVFLLFFSQYALQDTTFHFPNKVVFAVSVVAVVLLILFIKDLTNKKFLARNVALIIILVGGAACVIKAPQRGLDEESHLTYAIELADGNFFKYENDFNPAKVDVNVSQPDWNAVYNFDSLRNPSADNKLSNFLQPKHQSSKYSGKITGLTNLSYIPNAIGWDIGRIISNRVFVSYYLGRLFNVLAFALLAFFAVKISKRYSEVLYLFATFPTTLWIVAGYSYDYLYYGLALILFALFTNFFAKEKSIGKKESLLFIGLSSLMIFPKFPFVLIGTFICVFPSRYYKSARDRIFAGVVFLMSMILAGIYYISGSILTKIFHSVSPTNNPTIQGGGIFSLVAHPGILLRTFFFEVLGSIGVFSGTNQGNPPAPLQYTNTDSAFLHNISPFLFVLLLVLVSANIQIKIPNKIKVFIVGVFLAISFMIMYAMAGDSRVGMKSGDVILHGVQFRYFYLMFLTVPFFISDKIKMLFKSSDNNLLRTKDSSVSFLQYSLIFLNIFVLGIAIFSYWK